MPRPLPPPPPRPPISALSAGAGPKGRPVLLGPTAGDNVGAAHHPSQRYYPQRGLLLLATSASRPPDPPARHRPDASPPPPPPCKSCLYTGVATCAALSAYFVKGALEIDATTSSSAASSPRSSSPSGGSRSGSGRGGGHGMMSEEEAMRGAKKMRADRRFMLVGAACWGAAGLYRLYLG